jgi:hypothetical protein
MSMTFRIGKGGNPCISLNFTNEKNKLNRLKTDNRYQSEKVRKRRSSADYFNVFVQKDTTNQLKIGG